jgi:hypothetical protein
MRIDVLLERRYDKFRRMGVYDEQPLEEPGDEMASAAPASGDPPAADRAEAPSPAAAGREEVVSADAADSFRQPAGQRPIMSVMFNSSPKNSGEIECFHDGRLRAL